jgi:PiT family inorganic phosphate transporter
LDIGLLVIAVIATALIFDFTNGFHDTANAMATSIATGALRPKVAVGLSAVLNLAGAFLSIQVAKTISSGIVSDTKITPAVIFGGLIGAIVWNLLTWFVGLPSSSSHALFGGLIGATWIAAGSSAVHFGKIVEKILVPAIASPIIAGIVALIATYLSYRITRNVDQETRKNGFRYGQTVTACLVSLAHGTGDAQKTMGVITLTLVTAGALPSGSIPPLWVILAAAVAMALGTYAGGWRVIRTMGKGITDIESPQGFAAETSSATTLLLSSHLGFALSSTHVVSGSVVGVGLGRRLTEVRWGVAGQMVIAWALTLPAAAAVGAGGAMLTGLGTPGVIAAGVIALVLGGGLYLASRRNPVNAQNVNEDKALSQQPEQPTATVAH